MILDKDPAAINDEDNDSQTALHLACVHGKYDVVELLLDKGPHPRMTSIESVNRKGVA